MLFKDRAIIRLEAADSTNNYAANIIRLSSPPEGTVITAQHQSGGKGQRGALWESDPGENLLCSLILYPNFLSAAHYFYLSQTISLALREIVENHTGQPVYVKWPNDIVLNNKKLAGILMEATWSGSKMQSAIAGMGINLNQISFQHPNAISIRQVTGQSWDVDDCLVALLSSIDKYYLKLQSGNFSEISRLYRQHLFRIGQVGRYIFRGAEIEATITGVDETGRLKLISGTGERITCDLKEIGMVW